MNDAIATLEEYGIFPIVEIQDIDTVRPLVRTLVDAGLPVIEIPVRTAHALDAIKIVRDEFPDVLIGAGTILTQAAAKQAHEAGARFLLAPGFNPAVVDYCTEHGYAFIPGVHSPTELDSAIGLGLEAVKFFPAEESGGLRYLKAIAGPFKSMRFMPTGGINDSNIAQYLGYKPVLACGGSWIASGRLVAERKFEEIGRQIRSSLEASRGFEIMHIETAEGKGSTAHDSFGDIFPFLKIGDLRTDRIAPDATGSGKTHAGTEADMTIVISTISLKRAALFFRRKGMSPSVSADTAGKECKAIYLQPRGSNITYKIVEKSRSV